MAFPAQADKMQGYGLSSQPELEAHGPEKPHIPSEELSNGEIGCSTKVSCFFFTLQTFCSLNMVLIDLRNAVRSRNLSQLS